MDNDGIRFIVRIHATYMATSLSLSLSPPHRSQWGPISSISLSILSHPHRGRNGFLKEALDWLAKFNQISEEVRQDSQIDKDWPLKILLTSNKFTNIFLK